MVKKRIEVIDWGEQLPVVKKEVDIGDRMRVKRMVFKVDDIDSSIVLYKGIMESVRGILEDDSKKKDLRQMMLAVSILDKCRAGISECSGLKKAIERLGKGGGRSSIFEELSEDEIRIIEEKLRGIIAEEIRKRS